MLAGQGDRPVEVGCSFLPQLALGQNGAEHGMRIRIVRIGI